MSSHTRLALLAAGAAVVLGLLGDILFRGAGCGINLLLFLLAATSLASTVYGLGGCKKAARAAWLAPVALLFGALPAWRDSSVLEALDLLAATTLLSLLLLHLEDGRVLQTELVEYPRCLLRAPGQILTGFPALFWDDVHWSELSNDANRNAFRAVLKGLLLAAPILLVFGLLFAAGDAVFQSMVNRLLDIDLSQVWPHLFWIAAVTWICGGALRIVLLRETPAVTTRTNPGGNKLGALELSVGLGLVNLLFALFVFVQIRYFFGGAAAVHAVSGLTYAEYARSGFFQLSAAAALVLPLLLWLHGHLRLDDRAAEAGFRFLAGFQIVMVGVILASALQRMNLYSRAYGLTELRFYTTAFIAWLAVLFVWLAITVLRGQRRWFAAGALGSALVVILTLNVLNPDAWIVRANLDHFRATGRFDARYASTLSADAAPLLRGSLPILRPRDRVCVLEELNRRWGSGRPQDWREWNWSRAEARGTL